MTKKIMAILLALGCLFAFTAGAGAVVNPVSEVTEQELLDQLGISFAIPEDATDVVFSIIGGSLAQVVFTLDGDVYTCRMEATDELSEITGMYFDWAKTEEIVLDNAAEAVLRLNDGEQGEVIWYNVVYGMTAAVIMEEGATADKLMAVAEPIAAAMTQEDDGDHMAVEYEVDEEGTTLTIWLEANATTGYSWAYTFSNEKMLKVEHEDYAVNEHPEGMVGVGGVYEIALSPTMEGAGSVTLTLTYSQSWDTQTAPVETVIFDIWVVENGTLSVEGMEYGA